MTTDTELYARMGKVEGEVESIKKTQGSHGDMLQQILNRLSGHRSFDFAVTIDIAYKGAVLFGLISAGIIYLASNLNAGPGAVRDWRLQQLEDRLDRTLIIAKKGDRNG